MTFLTQHIIFWYYNKKKSKISNHKNCIKMKNIWLVCKKVSSINVCSFSNFLKFSCIFENVYLVSLFWEWPIYDASLLFNHYLHDFTVLPYLLFIITVSVRVIFMPFVTTLCQSIFHFCNVRVQFADPASEWFIYSVYIYKTQN